MQVDKVAETHCSVPLVIYRILCIDRKHWCFPCIFCFQIFINFRVLICAKSLVISIFLLTRNA